MMEGDRG